MLRNYLKTAWRNLLKSKLYSVINIAGLTIGLAIGMLILLWVQDELSFDSFHSKASTIYRVNSLTGTGQSRKVWDNAQGPVATTALREVPGVTNAVRIGFWGGNIYRVSIYNYKDKELPEKNNAAVDASFFKMFDFKMIKGDRNKPFPTDRSVVITQSTALKYFGNEDPIGKILQKDHSEYYTVSGVIADFPDNSSINYNMLFSMRMISNQYDGKGFWKSLDTNWGNFGFFTYLEIQPGTNMKKISDIILHRQLVEAPQIKVNPEDGYNFQPIGNIHLYQADGSSAGMQTVRIFLIIGIVTLLIACINYVNLSTARSMLRAKEVSIRKIVGAQKQQLFAQFIIESMLFFCISLVLAFAVIYLLLPYYNNISGKHLHLNLLDLHLWKTVLITFGGTLFISAIYPSLLLSSFEPLKALRGKLSLGIGNATFRKILVTTQFVFSVTLIIVTMVIGKQLKYIKEANPGYDRSQIFSFRLNGKLWDHRDAVKAELKANPGVIDLATTNNLLVNNGNTTAGVDWDGKDKNLTFIIHHFAMDANFIPLVKLQMAAGTSFSGSIADSSHYILNETAVKMTGLKNPIGQRFHLLGHEGTIIGVIKDFNTASFKEKIEPTVIYYEPAGFIVYIKTTGKQAQGVIENCKKLWDKYNAGFPFEYAFMDEQYDALYKSDQRSGVLFNIFSAIAIVISCLGLFGLATYTAQIMTKEIGIRKVLGASVTGIITLVSKDFLKLVLIAIVIASPIAWWAINQWLQGFAYKIDVSAWIFVISGTIAISIALLTISFQTIKAALANPVESLRSE